MLSTGVYEFGLDQADNTNRFQDHFRDVGIHIDMIESKPGPRYGVVLFTEPDEQVQRLLRQRCRCGQLHSLAVKVGRPLRPEETWGLLEAGAADVLIWGDDRKSAERIKSRLERWAAVDELLDSDWVRQRMIGTSPNWRRKLRQLVEAARFTASPVLLMGESGTGKELAACLIHELDPKPNKGALHVLDCTTIMTELSGSEFFGHERGAFTGAVAQREGAFALANGGTLFLDEIGELSMPLQAQLLRVIQEGTYKRVGGNTWLRTAFRLVCATNRNLKEQVRHGTFRGDLYFRIASLVHTLPPLRERPEDILPLVRHFMRELHPEQEPPELDAATQDYFLRHDYAGNVRELKQRVARLMHRYVGCGLLSAGHIPPEERPAPDDPPPDWKGTALERMIRRAIALGTGLKEISRTVEDLAVNIAVDDAGGNLQQAAQALGVTDRALQMRRANRRQIKEDAN
jgi:transcriptional regulator with GAF, ATPase, and Fis domain